MESRPSGCDTLRRSACTAVFSAVLIVLQYHTRIQQLLMLRLYGPHRRSSKNCHLLVRCSLYQRVSCPMVQGCVLLLFLATASVRVGSVRGTQPNRTINTSSVVLILV